MRKEKEKKNLAAYYVIRLLKMKPLKIEEEREREKVTLQKEINIKGKIQTLELGRVGKKEGRRARKLYTMSKRSLTKKEIPQHFFFCLSLSYNKKRTRRRRGKEKKTI